MNITGEPVRSTMSLTLTVEGMSCEHCEQTVREALENVDGVTEVSVDRETAKATVEGDAEVGTLVDAVDEAGYDASA
jgi:copper chaperone CopZ